MVKDRKQDVIDLFADNSQFVNKKGNILYKMEQKTIDNNSGEIVTQENNTVLKISKTDNFFYMFSAGINILTQAELTKLETQVLLLSSKYTIEGNMVVLNSLTRQIIKTELNINDNTLKSVLSKLTKKNMYYKEKSTYFLNPLIFGKGNFSKVKMLRQNFDLRYDFNTYKVDVQLQTETLNRDEDLESGKQFKIVSYQDRIDNGIKTKEVTIQPIENIENIKELEKPEYKSFIQEQNSKYIHSKPSNEQIELEMIKEKNRSLELEIEFKKASTEELNTKIKAREMGLI